MVYVADRRLYLNEDRTKVVDEDSPEAAFLLIGEGGTLTDDEAAKYGLNKARRSEAATDETAEEKAIDAPANKARTKAEDK